MDLMHLSKASFLLSWRWDFLLAVFFAVTFHASFFFLLLSATCLHCAILRAVRYIPKVESGFLLVAASSFSSFTFLYLSIIINSLFISWIERKFRFYTVPYAAVQRRMFLDCSWILSFALITTIGLLVLVVINLIGASVSSVILLIPFEDVWMEAIHACVFVIMLGALRGIILV